MLWFILALLSTVFGAAQNLIHRTIMIKADPFAYAFVENLFTLIVFIPFAIFAWQLPEDPMAWVLVIIGGLLWSAIAVISMFSYKYTKVSLRAPLSETRILWVVLFGALILSEAITLQKIFGVLIVFCGVIILTYQPGLKSGSFKDKGVQFTLFGSFALAFAAIIDKKALSYFAVPVYSMFVYLIPSIIIGSFALTRKQKDVRFVVSKQYLLLIIIGVLSAIVYFLQLKAYQLADVSVVYPVLRLATIFTVIGGIIFLHERENIVRKLIATAVVVTGVVIVSGYYTLF